MATVTFFHAHPDDEAIATGGTMIGLADAGHRVVLVTATRGELGETPEGLLGPGESLVDRRRKRIERGLPHPRGRPPGFPRLPRFGHGGNARQRPSGELRHGRHR